MIGVFVQLNEESIWARRHPVGYVVTESGCWEWTGQRLHDGYGRWRSPETGKMMLTHRYMYEKEKGAIPDGLTIDHLCRNRLCMNPAHMEAVTIGVNTRRGKPVHQTHCKRGHLLADDNLSKYALKRGCRCCMACSREHHRSLYWRKKMAANG